MGSVPYLALLVAAAFGARPDVQLATVNGAGLHHLKRNAKRPGASHLGADTSSPAAPVEEHPKSNPVVVQASINDLSHLEPQVFAHWTDTSKAFLACYLTSTAALAMATAVYAAVSKTYMDQDVRKRLSVLAMASEKSTGGEYVQTGYKQYVGGRLLMFCWVPLLVIPQVFMAFIVFAKIGRWDPLGLIKLDHGYESLVEPLITVLFLSSAALALSTRVRAIHIVEAFMSPCPLGEADTVLVEDCRSNRTQACRTTRQGNGSPPSFIFFCFRYVYVEKEDRFRPMGHETVTGELAHKRLGAKGLSDTVAMERHLKEGENAIDVEVPGVFASLFEEFHSMHFIYCTLNCWLSCAVDYQLFAYVLFALSVGSGLASAFVERRGRLNVRDLARLSTEVHVMRDGVVHKLQSESLVPGDLLLVLPNTTMPCDCVLVSGEAVMNEGVLTGEPMPTTKVPIEMAANAPRKANMLLSATQVLDSNGSVEGVAVAIVQAIGGASKKASLIRLVLFPEDNLGEYHADLAKVYVFLAALAMLVGLSILVLPHPLNTQKHVRFLPIFLRFLYFPLDAVHPFFFVTIAAARYVASTQLAADGINCIAAERVPLAGAIDTLVLDKTGTITKDCMEFHGVEVVSGSAMGEVFPKHAIEQLPSLMSYLMASCHNLSQLGDDLLGNHVEIEMFRALGNWQLDMSNPEGTTRVVTDGQVQLEVLRWLEFQHDCMTSGCICRLPNGEHHVFIKGATSQILNMCPDAPTDFMSRSEKWSTQGYYALACAWKPLGELSVSESTREQLEANLTAGGLMLFQNELKPDSTAAIAEMRDGGLACKICTGDHLMTGVSVAKATGIIQPGQPVYCLTYDNTTDSESQDSMDSTCGLWWVKIEEEIPGTHLQESASPFNMVPDKSAALVVGKRAWDKLHTTPLAASVLPQIVVFGRMLPDDKVTVVRELQKLGFYVGMCGDGGNDCGALRAAHVGLALSAAEASIVAPFSSKADLSLFNMVVLLKEGRACMASNHACHIWFVLYGVTAWTEKFFECMSSDAVIPVFAWMLIGVVLPSLLPLGPMLLSPRAASLSPCKVSCSVKSLRMVMTSVGLYTVFVAQLTVAWKILQNQPFFYHFSPVVLGFTGNNWNEISDNFEGTICFMVRLFFLSILSLVLSLGGKHRMPIWKNTRLLLVACALLVLSMLVLCGQNTYVHVALHTNCDAESTLAKSGRCFNGPQMRHWGDNAANVTGKVMSISEMVAESREEHDGERTCLPKASTMREQLIPPEFQSLTAINNILSPKYRQMFIGITATSACLMFLFQKFVVSHAWFDRLESKPSRKRLN